MATRPITTVSLNPYFVDKDTGAPLSGGQVQFWKDSDRVVPKLVYQKVNVGADPVTGNPTYEFVALPDPITLSAVGTFQDNNGNQIAVYYFPFEGTPDDSTGIEELYYVAVFNSLGVPQFVREGWPDGGSLGNGGNGDGIGMDNMISNSQFVDVSFNPAVGYTYTSSGAGGVNINIAPDWILEVVFTGVNTVTIARTAITGTQNLDTNPPYTLTITPGNTNISSIKLKQRLRNNPGIWSAITAGVNGYVASFILLGGGSQAIMRYEPSVGAPQQLLAANNMTATFVGYSETVQLTPSANTQTADVGYVDISIQLSATSATSLSSVQVIGTDSNVEDIEYLQETVNRQKDHLFHYYNDLLQYMPISNLLDAWDFPLNPAQPLGSTVAASAIGANKSKYVWDQTIIFQSANSGVGVSRSIDGSIVLTAAATTQMALIQYQPQVKARKILFNKAAVHIVADSTVVQNFTVSLWYTLDGSLPSTIGSNNSLVLTLGANGKPATFNGNWVEVPRSNNLGDATFSTDGSGGFETFKFSGWQLQTADVHTATFFAIVIGTNSVVSPNSVVFNSVNLCPGDIATVPAPQSLAEATLDCEYYYTKSFALADVPATQVGFQDALFFPSTRAGAVGIINQKVMFSTSMYAIPTMTYYNPVNNNALAYNATTTTDMATTTSQQLSEGGFTAAMTGDGGMAAGNVITLHWTADARLGA